MTDVGLYKLARCSQLQRRGMDLDCLVRAFFRSNQNLLRVGQLGYSPRSVKKVAKRSVDGYISELVARLFSLWTEESTITAMGMKGWEDRERKIEASIHQVS